MDSDAYGVVPTSRTTFFTTSKTVEANMSYMFILQNCENYKILEESKNRKKLAHILNNII